MKKRLLLTLFAVALFTVLLTLGVSASTIYKDSEGNTMFSYELDENSIISTYTGEFPRVDGEGNHLTWYVTKTETVDGNTVKTVASFKTMDEGYMTLSNGTYTYKRDTGVTNRNIVAVYFPNDCGIKVLNLADSGYHSGYDYTKNTAEILFVYLPNTLTVLPDRIVQATRALVCDIPYETPITRISNVAFHASKCLREIKIPSTVTIIDGKSANDGAAFYMCDSLEKVTFGENSVLETIGNYAFHKCIKLSVLSLPNSVKTINTHAFSYTALVDSPFGEGSQCETLGGRAFSDITTLKTFIVPATLKSVGILGSNDHGPLALCTGIELVTFGNAAPITELMPSFFGKATIGKVVLPNGPTNIPNRYFISANIKEVAFSDTIETASERVFQNTTIEIIRLGANFKHFVNSIQDHQSFTNSTKGLKEIYIPASFYATAPDAVYQVSYVFDCGGNSGVKFFYTGTAEELAISLDNFKNQTIKSGENNWRFLGATQVSYDEYIKDTEKYASSHCIIYGYDPCEAFCKPFYAEDHENKEVIKYESYLKPGTKSIICTICQGAKSTEVEALFVCNGYSIPENGNFGIVVGFGLNKDAIDSYVSLMNKSFGYGLFAVSKNKLGNNDIINADGSAADGAIVVKMDYTEVEAAEIKITGFTTEALRAVEIAFGAYVITTDSEGTVVSYLQPGEPSEGSAYTFVSYNSLTGNN